MTITLRRAAALTAVVASLAASPGCRRETGASLTVAGSTSVQPFAELVADLYMRQQRGTRVNVQGGGSSAGIQAVENGACQIGMSSRELKPAEQKLLRRFLVAHDAIVLIVHPSNPVRDLSLAAVRAIFTGDVRDWRDVGGRPGPIDVINREEGSGTRQSFENYVLGDALVRDDALVQDSNGAVREIVATDPRAIGYISHGLVDNRERAVALGGVEPSIANIRGGTYKMVRPFLLVTRGAPTPPAQAFIRFFRNPPAQALLQEEGLIPLTSAEQHADTTPGTR